MNQRAECANVPALHAQSKQAWNPYASKVAGWLVVVGLASLWAIKALNIPNNVVNSDVYFAD